MIQLLLALITGLLVSMAALPRAAPGAVPDPTATLPAPPESTSRSTDPVRRPDHKRWRIGYVESGLYAEYPATLRAVTDGLQQLGWLDLPAPMPENINAAALWHWLSQNSRSNYLEFVPDAYWTPGNFDSTKRQAMREHIQARITHKHDIDLLIAMGTWAGQDLRAIGPPVPTIVAAASDPLSSGIIDSVEDSGRPNLHARVEPERYQRQLRLFHDTVPFNTLGVVYANTPTERTYAALGAIKKASASLGFDVVHCYAASSDINAEQAIQNAVNCYQRLADQHVDAVYVTSHRGVTPASIGDIAAILRKAGVPSFSMQGGGDVEKGILLSMNQADMTDVGLFHAEAIAKVFNGAAPRDLNQIWIGPIKISLNLATARLIGFDPPIEVLLAADDIYNTAPDIH